MSVQELIRTLYDNRLLDTPEQVNSFNVALTRLRTAPKTRTLLSEALFILDDGAVELTSMWSLVHYVEDYDLDVYVQSLVDFTLTSNASKAAEWIRILYVRLVNNEHSRTYLKELLPKLPKHQREAIKRLLEQIAQHEIGNPELEDALRRKISFIVS